MGAEPITQHRAHAEWTAPLTPRRHVEILAARAWPADDLAKRARKTSAVLAKAGVGFGRDDEFTAAELFEIEKVFGQLEVGDVEAWPRGDGTYEIRRTGIAAQRARKTKRGRR